MTEISHATTAAADSGNGVSVIGYAPPAPQPGRRGRGFLPAAASFYLPGLGQLIAGERRRAVTWFAAWLVISILGIASIAVPAAVAAIVVLAPVGLAFNIACVVDAFRRGRASQARLLGSPARRYLAGAGIVVGGCLGLHPTAPVPWLVREKLVEAFAMTSASMAPAIQVGDRVLVHGQFGGELRRWDLVVFDPPDMPGERHVFRIAGLPGETVEIVGTEMHVNGSPVAPPQGVGPYQEPFRGISGNASRGKPLTLGSDEYFVRGDNAPIARDGRYWEEPAGPGRQPGALPRERIIGKVTTRYWPPSRWSRF